MKKIKSLLILTAILALPLIYFTACSNKSEINEPNQVNFDSPTMAIIDFNDAQNGIEDATLETGMTLSPSLFSYSFINDKNFTPGNSPMMGMVAGNMWMGRFDWGKHLGFLFRKLNLTEAQKTEIGDLLKAYHDNLKPLIEKMRKIIKPIIDAANVERKKIVEDLKAGIINRAEAMKQLADLNKKTRTLINANPDVKIIKDSICKLRTDLFTNIAAKLTAEQLKIWTDAVSKIKSPC